MALRPTNGRVSLEKKMPTKNDQKKKPSGPLFNRRVNRKAEKMFLSRRRMERHVEQVRLRDSKSPAPAV